MCLKRLFFFPAHQNLTLIASRIPPAQEGGATRDWLSVVRGRGETAGKEGWREGGLEGGRKGRWDAGRDGNRRGKSGGTFLGLSGGAKSVQDEVSNV